MDNQATIEAIQSAIKGKGYSSVNTVLVDSGVGKDLISNMRKGQIPSIEKILMLADHLEISVDYLLGRTGTYTASHISNSAVAQGNNSKAINGKGDTSMEEAELFRIYSMLNPKQRHKLMGLAFELEEIIAGVHDGQV